MNLCGPSPGTSFSSKKYSHENTLIVLIISFQVHASGVRVKSHQLELQAGSAQTVEYESIQELKNYCPGSDDLLKCRLKVENDCENEVSNKSCKIWNRINQTFGLSFKGKSSALSVKFTGLSYLRLDQCRLFLFHNSSGCGATTGALPSFYTK